MHSTSVWNRRWWFMYHRYPRVPPDAPEEPAEHSDRARPVRCACARAPPSRPGPDAVRTSPVTGTGTMIGLTMLPSAGSGSGVTRRPGNCEHQEVDLLPSCAARPRWHLLPGPGCQSVAPADGPPEQLRGRPSPPPAGERGPVRRISEHPRPGGRNPPPDAIDPTQAPATRRRSGNLVSCGVTLPNSSSGSGARSGKGGSPRPPPGSTRPGRTASPLIPSESTWSHQHEGCPAVRESGHVRGVPQGCITRQGGS